MTSPDIRSSSTGGYDFVRFGDGADEIWSGDHRAFLLAQPGQPARILSGFCPHRGGPLALGEFDCRSKSLRCPWHGQRHGPSTLRALALPAIRIGDTWLVAFEAQESTPGPLPEPICFRRAEEVTCQPQAVEPSVRAG